MTTAELADQMNAETQNRAQQQQAQFVDEVRNAPLFPENELTEMRSRWQQIQGNFVDDPRGTVQQADEMVANTIRRLAEVFAGEKSKMEQTWSRGDNVNTEDLRQAFHRYRSFFDRLLSA